MSAPMMAGAEPLSIGGGLHGALVLHGFTGTPQSMRGLADAMAGAGFAVEVPLLPGHGTAIEDMVTTRWSDWSGAAEDELVALAGRTRRVAVIGLSMGGTLACWLATRHPEVGAVVLVNPMLDPPAASFRDILEALLESGVEVVPGPLSDTGQPGVTELGYDGAPLAAALSLFEALDDLAGQLHRLRCPALLFSSRHDEVVPSESGDLAVQRVGGPVERVWLEHSSHVATLDQDRAELEARALSFVRQALAADQPAPQAPRPVGTGGILAEGEATPLERLPLGGTRGAKPPERYDARVPGPITRADVAHVARLNRLALSDDELDAYAGQLSAVLEYAADIAALDTSGLVPTAHPLPVSNVWRDDVARPGLQRAEVLAQAPAPEDGRFRVPPILGEDLKENYLGGDSAVTPLAKDQTASGRPSSFPTGPELA